MIYIAIAAGILLLLLLWYIYSIRWCYNYVFSRKSSRGPQNSSGKADEKKALAKEKHKKQMEELRSLSHDDVSVTSYDGLRLEGKFFPASDSKSTVIIFHGYRSNLCADSSLITKHCLERGFNVLAVHQRAHGESEGQTITFGVRERIDCKSWVDYTVSRIGSDSRIMLMGVSMGASTVMMASDLDIPNVYGIFADCGFSSPKEILKVVIKSLSYPVGLAYHVVRAGAILFGGFDPEKESAEKSLANSSIPITIIHSETDSYVPCYMAKKCFDAAKAEKKKLVIIPEAAHAYSYFYETEIYESALDEMLDSVKNKRNT
ncbi:MAG: alpha/beta hydrolase [Clostridia bacterium]|nr:alpha/beta hydrolase [Clostridia bacterium]